MKKLLLPLMFILICCCAEKCSNTDSLCTGEYMQWIENPENGLHIEKKLNSLLFDLQYKPLDYVVVKESGDAVGTEGELEARKNELKDMQYFTFRISGEKGGDLLQDDVSTMDQFSARLAYFSSGMQRDVKLVENGDTLNCLLFHFERTYGVDPRSTFVLGFPLVKGEKEGGLPSVADKIFLFDDHQLGAGPVYITIGAAQLNNIPTLKLK